MAQAVAGGPTAASGAAPPPPPPGGGHAPVRPQPPQQQQQQQRPPGAAGGSGSGSRPPGSSHSQRPRPPGGAGGASGSGGPAAAATGGKTNELEQRLRRDTPFICEIKFKNDLPEIPADPKLLLAPPDPAALSAFAITSLERRPLRDLLLPGDLGVPITLLDTDRYNAPPEGQQGQLDPKDAALLQSEVHLPGAGPSPAKPKRFAGKGVEVSWLMRTTYISAATEAGAAAAAADAARRGAGARGAAEELGADQTREGQIRDIEATFEAARRPILRHPHKRGVTAAEVLPLLPDLENWPNKYIQVLFDEEPTADGAMAAIDDPKLRRAVADRTLLKSYNVAQGEGAPQVPALAMLVPKAPLEAARAGDASALPAEEDAAAVEGDYLWDQEYTWGQLRKRDDDPAPDAYLLRRAEDKAAYSVFTMKVRCRKRKRKPDDDPVPAGVVITNRELTEAELSERADNQHPDAAAGPEAE